MTALGVPTTRTTPEPADPPALAVESRDGSVDPAAGFVVEWQVADGSAAEPDAPDAPDALAP